jgi:hypothetical protein
MFIEGQFYEWRDIAESFELPGEGGVWFLPHRSGKTLCGLFRRELNPDAPETVIVGEGSERLEAAEVFSKQTESVPCFIRDRTGLWKYHGRYRYEDSTVDPARIVIHREGSEYKGAVPMVLFLRKKIA